MIRFAATLILALTLGSKDAVVGRTLDTLPARIDRSRVSLLGL